MAAASADVSVAVGLGGGGTAMSLVTGPDSRVASYVGGVAEIPKKTARRPPSSALSHSREGSGCCEVQGLWPISQDNAPRPGSLAGSSWSSRPEERRFPHLPHLEWSGVRAGLSSLLRGGSPGLQATPPPRGSLLPCARDQPSPPMLSLCGGLQGTTHSSTIWKSDGRWPSTCSNSGPSQGHLPPPMGVCQQGRLKRPASFTPQTPAGQRGRDGALVRNSCSDSAQ